MNEIHSEYYETTYYLTDDNLDDILFTYEKEMEKEGQEGECDDIEQMKMSISIFDHVLYHAMMSDTDGSISEMLEF